MSVRPIRPRFRNADDPETALSVLFRPFRRLSPGRTETGIRPLRVAVFTTSYPQDGNDPAGRFVFNAVEHLRSKHLELEVVGPGSYRDFGLTGSRRGGVVAAVKRRPWLALLLVASMALALRRAARRADLVHANWLAGAVIAQLSGKPFVVTLHGSGSAGRFSDLRLAERAPRLVRLLLRRARAVICCSEQLASAIRGCGLENVCAIPYGIDVPAEVGAEDSDAPVLYAGRLSPEKNIDVIAAATEGLPRIVAGDGPLRPLLPDTLGFVPPQDLAALYDRAGVVVLVSQMEGLPNVVLEAMAHGKTVVATPVGGIPTLIEDGVTGLLVPAGDAVALRAAIDRVRADAALRRHIGATARARVASYCSWSSVTARTMQVYADAAAPRRGRLQRRPERPLRLHLPRPRRRQAQPLA
jgi:glycosyltransferase involved in cell wall biosynthesis